MDPAYTSALGVPKLRYRSQNSSLQSLKIAPCSQFYSVPSHSFIVCVLMYLNHVGESL